MYNLFLSFNIREPNSNALLTTEKKDKHVNKE